MSTNDNLVPEPQSSIFDSVNKAVGDSKTARQIFANPQLAGTLSEPNASSDVAPGSSVSGLTGQDAHEEGGIPIKAVDDIGRATAEDVKEALHQVIDPELGIDVVDLGLVYGIEIDEQGRAIIAMTLTTPTCPLTELLEDECASTLAGLVEEFRIDWTWDPIWTVDMITPDGREQLAAIGFNLENMPKY